MPKKFEEGNEPQGYLGEEGEAIEAQWAAKTHEIMQDPEKRARLYAAAGLKPKSRRSDQSSD